MVDPTHDSERERGSSSAKAVSFFGAAIFCGLVGALIAFAPHLASRVWFGDWEFYQDFDEVLYRLVSKPALDGSWRMIDVFVQADRDLPTTYSWTQFVPTSHIARAFGFDALSLGQFWRLSGGFLMGVGLYVVFASFRIPVTRPRLFVTLAAVLALSDAGFVQGRVFLENGVLGLSYLGGSATKTQATAFAAYRVITPILNLPFSLMAAAMLSPLVLSRRPLNAVFAAVLTALTVTLYFFQWTALFSGAASFLTGCVIWDRLKKTEYRHASMIALAALAAGMAMGAPQILANAATFADPALKTVLERVGRGQVIPAGDPSLYINLMNRWLWLKMALAMFVAWKFRHRGLWLFVWIGFVGYVLANSAIITRTEFENWHWLYVFNPFLAVVIYVGVLAAAFKLVGPRVTAAVVGAFFVSGFALRSVEVALATESLLARSLATETRGMRPVVAAIPNDGKTCMAGDLASHILAMSMPGGRLLFHFPFSSQISLMSLEEVHERYVLSRWLCGMTRKELAETPDDKVYRVQPQQCTRPEWLPDAVRSAQLAVFDRLDSSPVEVRTLMAKYQPNWLLLSKQNHVVPPTRGGTWERIVESDRYVLWKRASD